MPTSRAVMRLISSESRKAAGSPMIRALTLFVRSSDKSIMNSLLLRMPIIR